jgi:hypothetical protein
MLKLLAGLSVTCLAMAACGSESHPPAEGAAHPMAKLSAGPGAFAPDFASSSDFFTRMNRLEKGRTDSPHGLVRMYYSANIRSVVDEPEFEVPVGTVAIKQQDHDGDGTIDNVLDMVKETAGFDSYSRRRGRFAYSTDIDVIGSSSFTPARRRPTTRT